MKPLPSILRLLSLLAAFTAFTWISWAEDDNSKAPAAPDASAPADQAAAPAPDSKATPAVDEAPAASAPAASVEPAAKPETEAVTPPAAPAAPEAPAVKANSDAQPDDKPANKDEKPTKKKKKHSIQIGPGTFQQRNDAPPFGNHTVRVGEKYNDIVSIFGNTVVEGEVESDAVAVFGNNDVKGKVGSDAVAVFGNLYVNSEVGGDAVAVFGNLTLGPKAKVNGECVNVFGHITRDPAAEVNNIQEVMSFANIPHFGSVGTWIQTCILRGRLLWVGPGLTWAWVIAGAHLLFYFVLALILGKPTEKCVNTLVENPGLSILSALLAFLLSPLVIVLLAITGVGVILIPFFGMFLFCASIYGRVVMHAWIGRPVIRLLGPSPFSHIAFAVLIGGVVITFLYCIPLIAFMTHALLGTIGLGVVILAILKSINREKKTTPPSAAPTPAAFAPPPAAPAPATPAAFAAMPAASAPFDSVAAPIPVAPASQPPVSPAGFAAEASTIPPAPQPVFTTPPSYQPFTATPPAAPKSAIVASSLPRASFWIRMGALVIDLILVSLLMGSMDAIVPHKLEVHFFPGIFFYMALYGALMWKLRGTTIGGIICKLQIVRTDDRPLDWATCVVRALGCVLSAFVIGLGFIWIAIDPNRESWHDKIAGTAVVVNPTGRSLV